MSDSAECGSAFEVRRGFLTVGGCRLSYLEWQSGGPAVLLLHGITSSARAWWRTAETLAQRGYHVYALDMPGHGQSEEIDDYHIDRLGALAAEALALLGLERPHLIGHSWGGATALALASAPDAPALASVTLIDPAMGMDPQRGAEMLPFYSQGVGEPPEQSLPPLRERNPDWHPCDFYWKGEALQQCRRETVRAVFTGSAPWRLAARPAEVQARLLVLVADPQHSVIPAAVLPEIEQAMRPGQGELRVIPGTNHNMLRGGFDKTLPVLLEWLER
ncbi:MAG TPA: alpha/beta hydrolase [Roseiflexaceae bacterium]|nr:alpha/beta hydrolase [Roseiflexaceae bacterium]